MFAVDRQSGVVERRRVALGIQETDQVEVLERLTEGELIVTKDQRRLMPGVLTDPGWAPLCAAIISGELMSTVTSLVLIPCLYVVLNADKANTAKTVSPDIPTLSGGKATLWLLSFEQAAVRDEYEISRRQHDPSQNYSIP